MKKLLLGISLLMACVLGSPPARAQTVTINVGAGLGSGLELGGQGATTVHHSPVYVKADVGLLLDNDQRFELGAALLMEVEGRIGVAVEPELRINTRGQRVRGYLMLGVPIFLAPYTLYGVAIGPGISVRLWGALRAFGEVVFRAYPFGNDLPDSSALFHADAVLGVRHAF